MTAMNGISTWNSSWTRWELDLWWDCSCQELLRSSKTWGLYQVSQVLNRILSSETWKISIKSYLKSSLSSRKYIFDLTAGIMADSTPKSYHTDPALYLYTSLTAGSSHIITATSRLETILKANKIPFLAVDVATDEKARMLWGRRAGKRKLPGLVRMGMIVGVR